MDHFAAPSCSSNPLIQSVCGDTEGFYYLTSIASSDEEPENTWEIRWTVEIGKSGELYTGGYNTTMVFDFDPTNGAWRIVFWQNLWSNTLNFTSCGASESVYEGSCKPKPSQPDLEKPSIDISKKLDDLETDDTSLIIKRTPTAAPISSKLIGVIGKHGSGKRSLDSSSKGSLLIRKSSSDSTLRFSNGLLSSQASDESESYDSSSLYYNITDEEEYEEGEDSSNPSLRNVIMRTVKKKRKSDLIDLRSINGGAHDGRHGGEFVDENDTSIEWDYWYSTGNYTLDDEEEEEYEEYSGEGGGSFVRKQKISRNSNTNGLLKGATNKRQVAKKGSDEMQSDQNTTATETETNSHERKSIFKNKKIIKFGDDNDGDGGFDVFEPEYGSGSTANQTSSDVSWSPVVDEEAVSDKTMVYQHVTDSSSTTEAEEEEESSVDSGATVSASNSGSNSASSSSSGKNSKNSKGESSTSSSSTSSSSGSSKSSSSSRQKTVSLSNGDVVDESDLSFASPSASKGSTNSSDVSSSASSGGKNGGNSGGLLKGSSANKRGSTRSGCKDKDDDSSSPSASSNSTDSGEEIKDDYQSPQITTPEVVKKLGRNRHKHPRVKKGYPSTLLEVKMFDSRGDGWYKANYEGSAFYISDETKTELLAYGTLENGTYSGFCSFCFDDGSYYFRATTDESNTGAKWSFCHTQGNIGEQLSFHIKDGRCIPDALVDVDMICDGTYSTVVTVRGKLAIAGVSTEMFDSQSASVVTHALSESVFGWDNSEILISETTLNMRLLRSQSQGGRELTSFVYDIDFEASFVSEMAYEVDGTSYYGVVGLVAELSEELDSALLSGHFIETVRTLALSSGVTSLDDVTGASLLSLEVEDISYVGTKELVLTADYQESGSETSSSPSSYFEDTLSSYQVYSFVAVVVLGFVSFVGVLSVTVQMNRNPSKGIHVLLPELDSSVSNHLTFTRPNRQNIQSAL